jgi:hypothetical protein
MLNATRLFGTSLLVCLLMIALHGCESPQPTGGTEPEPDETATTQAEPASEQAGEPAAAEEDEAEKKEKEAKERAKKARERERKLAKLQRDMEVSRLKLSKTKLSTEHSAAQHQFAIEKAEVDLEIARKELRVFNEISAPNRIARAELSFQWAEDNLTDAREELRQLELMYEDDQFADQTKEIVIDRARRRLQRTERDIELRREELKTLKEISLPMERKQKELAVVRSEESLEKLRRDRKTSEIGEEIGLIGAEMEIIRTEHSISDLEEEIEEAAEEEAKRAEKEAAEEKAESDKE